VGIFAKGENERLLRETPWPNAQSLAEELYAMFKSKLPFVIDGPVEINNPGDGPALTIRQNGNSDIALRIGENVYPPEHPPPQVPLPPEGTTDLDNQAGGGAGGGGGGGTPGTVVSGSGSSYQVQLASGGTVTVTQAPATTEDIPAGTPVIVTTYAGGHFMCHPVWL
jgi:hypothetical protein